MRKLPVPPRWMGEGILENPLRLVQIRRDQRAKYDIYNLETGEVERSVNKKTYVDQGFLRLTYGGQKRFGLIVVSENLAIKSRAAYIIFSFSRWVQIPFEDRFEECKNVSTAFFW